MKVLITGGRNYTNQALVNQVLDALLVRYPAMVLIHGDAKGADTLGRMWAECHSVPHVPYPAEWDKHKPPEGSNRKNPAGPIRNRKMLTEGKPDLVVAFAGGSGTADMVQIALDAGVRLLDMRRF